MGSKSSKTARRSHEATNSRPMQVSTSVDELQPRQDARLPDFKTTPPLDPQTPPTNAATSPYRLRLLWEAMSSNDGDAVEKSDDTTRLNPWNLFSQPPGHSFDFIQFPFSAVANGTQVSLTPPTPTPDVTLAPAPPPFPAPPAMSSPPPAPPASPPVTEVRCVVCCEAFSVNQEGKAYVLPCSSCKAPYCGKCVRDMFIQACKDSARMPPRCCYQFQIHFGRPYLSESEMAEFRAKYEEWSTPNAFYCPVLHCSAFISPRILKQAQNEDKGLGKQRVDSAVGAPTSSFLKCPTCSTSICTNCRELAHAGTSCKQVDFGAVDEQTAELLKSWGYKRCPNCGTGVRKMYGCSHMECRCGAHFCWYCLQDNVACDGSCGEGSDEDYTDHSDEEDESVQDALSAVEMAIATSTTVQRSNESASNTVTVHQLAPEITTSARRQENLDGRSGRYWQEADMDFGDEPEGDNVRFRSCIHRFSTKTAPPHTQDPRMECSKCWSDIRPAIQSPLGTNANNRMVPALSGSRSRSSNRVRGRERRTTRPASLSSLDRAQTGHRASPLSQSFPSDATSSSTSMLEPPVSSSNSKRVVDTYGNIITATDFILNPDPPRRASFDYSEMSKQISQADKKDHTHSPKKTSFAYECHGCHVLFCNDCMEEWKKEREANHKDR